MLNRDNRGPASAEMLEDEFHRLLGRLVRAIAAFEFNVGLQLNWLGSYAGRDVSRLLLPRQARLVDRLQALETLIVELYAPAGEHVLKDFRTWFAKAHRARGVRNDYAHGRWAVPGRPQLTVEGRVADAPALLTFVPLDFDMTPGRTDISIDIPIRTFRKQVMQAEGLFARYWDLCERHMASMKVSP